MYLRIINKHGAKLRQMLIDFQNFSGAVNKLQWLL